MYIHAYDNLSQLKIWKLQKEGVLGGGGVLALRGI